MKTLKKSLCIILSVMLILSCSVPAYAENMVYASKRSEILTDEFILNSNISIDNNVILFTKTSLQKNGENICETFYVVPSENIDGKTLSRKMTEFAQKKAATSNSTLTIEEYDSSISIKGWLQVSYSKTTSSWGTAAKVTSVSGGYTKDDRSVSVTSQELVLGSSGKSASTGRVISQRSIKKPTTSSWSYTAPTSWHYIVKDGFQIIGAYCDYSLKRYGSTWDFTVSCMVI